MSRIYTFLLPANPQLSHYIIIHAGGLLDRVEGGYYPRPSPLDLDVKLSPHPAPDVLNFRFCSCGYNRGSFRGLLEGCFFSSSSGFYLHDVGVLFRH